MRNYLMSWVPAAHRWTKMYRYKTYSVSCTQLGCPETKEASWRQANQWWTNKQIELDAIDPPKKKVHHHQAALNTTAERLDWAKLHAPQELPELKQQLEETRKAKPDDFPPEDERHVANTIAAFERETGVRLPDDVSFETLQKFFGKQQLWEDRLKALPVTQADADNTIRHHATEYLKLKASKKPGTYTNIKTQVDWFVNFCPGTVKKIDEALWESVFVSLKGEGFADSTLFGKLSGIRAFVNYLYEKKVISELPRNINSSDLTVTVRAKKIVVPELDAVKALLKDADGVLKCWLMLMCNTGMQQTDISELTPTEVDWENGTITRKRTKTMDTDAPTITYPLWASTFELLKEHASGRNDLVFVSSRNTKLVVRGQKKVGEDETKGTKKDLIQLAWKRWNKGKHQIQLKELRKVCATLIASRADGADLTDMYLGHTPSKMSTKHYADPPQVRFEVAVKWLGEQLAEV